MLLKTLFIWRFVFFAIISGHVLLMYPFSKPQQSVQDAPTSSQALGPETWPDTEPGDKKGSPPPSALLVKGEQSFLMYLLSEPEQSVQDAPRSSEALGPETSPDTEPGDKKGSPPSSALLVKGEQSFLTIIQKVSLRYDIDPALVRAIIMAESRYNPNAISHKGAKGLMQLMPVTAKRLGVEDVFNPEQNIHGGVRHFKFLLKQFDGDVKLAVAAYNAGSRPVKRYKDIPPYKETKRFVRKVFQYYEFYKERG